MTRTSIPTEAFLTRPQQDALRALVHADGWDQRPCADATAWELPPIKSGGGGSPRLKQLNQLNRRLDIQDRRNACRTCPILTECTRYANTNPYVTGVIAGRLGPAT